MPQSFEIEIGDRIVKLQQEYTTVTSEIDKLNSSLMQLNSRKLEIEGAFKELNDLLNSQVTNVTKDTSEVIEQG